MPGTILLTGFEPFGKWEVNPSWEIARRLDGEQLGGLIVAGRRLPVNWEGTWPALRDAINETAPDAILMLGLAGNRPCISVEAQGLNGCGDTPDNEGKQFGSGCIVEGGRSALQTTLPVAEIVARIQALGLPVALSQDAGGYLCNFATYKALAWANDEERAIPVGFIHLPNVRGVAAVDGGLTLEAMGSAVCEAIMAIAALIEAGKAVA